MASITNMSWTGTFRDLVWHFFGRFFDKESLSPQGEPAAGLFQTLGMLIPPGAFVCLLMSIFHPLGWDLVTLRFLFICFSMIAIGVVMVFEWDALFPDKRDYLILGSLPLRFFTLFLAKMAALGLFLGIFLGAVNGSGILFWPAVERQHEFFSIAGTHMMVTCAAGLFSALAIGALRGILVTVFRGALYRRISVLMQTVVMALLIMFLFLSPMMGSAVGRLCRANSPYLRWFPGFWFAGWYEQIRPSFGAHAPASDLVLRSLGPMAPRAMWIALGLFVLTFLPGYRSHARRVLEAPEPNPRGPGRIRRAIDSVINRLLGDPVECAVFHFIGQTIMRSLKHRLFLATYGGFGAAIVAMTVASGGSSRRVPLMLSFVLVSGLRAAFNFPSDLAANWAFRVSETTPVTAYVRATRKWVMLYAILPLCLLMAGFEAGRSPWNAIAFHFAFLLSSSIVLTEALFLGFQRVPFTCSRFPGKVNMVFLSVLYLFGFIFYSDWMASLEDFLPGWPVFAVLYFLAVGGVLVALARTRSEIVSTEDTLEFEDDGNPEVCILGITE